MRILSILAAGLILSGCATAPLSGDANGVMVQSKAGLQDAAYVVADKHCKEFGKRQEFHSEDPRDGTVTFDCVSP